MCLLVAQTIASEWLMEGGGGGGEYQNDPQRLTFPPSVLTYISALSHGVVFNKPRAHMPLIFPLCSSRRVFRQSSVFYQKMRPPPPPLYVAVQRGCLALPRRVFVVNSGSSDTWRLLFAVNLGVCGGGGEDVGHRLRLERKVGLVCFICE